MIRKLLSIILVIIVAASIGFADNVKSRSMFTDHKAHEVGDLITILIVESSSASNKAKTTTEKSTEVSTEQAAGTGIFDFFPMWGYSGGNESKFDGKGQTEKTGSLRAKMTVEVTAIKPNGDLVIEGNRLVKIDDEEETLYLSGSVRSRDVSDGNTVYSYQIANAQISTRSKGTVTNGHRPGFLTRIINWIF